MTTLWWAVVVWLGCGFAFVAGFVVRGEFERWAHVRQPYVRDIDLTPRSRTTR